MRILVLPACVLMSFAWIGAVSSQAIVKKEPGPGTLRSSEFVYVDDGSCPKGQIMKVSGAVTGGRGEKQPRPHQCVPHP